MINIYKNFVIFFFIIYAINTNAQNSDRVSYLVDELSIKGNYKTNKKWLIEFIGYKFPLNLSVSDLDNIRDKLLSTEIFYDVNLILEQKVYNNSVAYRLVIILKEKWTIIPVIRGGLGGNNYYRVFGIYDIHSFGKLWTIGMQNIKYKDSPDGWVIWAKAPRWLDGSHSIGIEVWNNYKERIIYNKSNIKSHLNLCSHWEEFRFFYLYPILWSYQKTNYNIQTGLDLKIKREYKHNYKFNNQIFDVLENFYLINQKQTHVHIALHNIYDDINVKQFNYHGKKIDFNIGPLFFNKKSFYKFEFDFYNYHHYLAYDFNVSGHFFIGSTNFKDVENQFYLGGLDSIRGIYDGFLYGTKAYYLNLELKKIFLKFKYMHLLGVFFIDLGGAHYSWDTLLASSLYTTGLGLRINFPKVYRLMFRIDYGWSFTKPYQKGWSLGMNDLFQPYKPL